jgi:hypothetical protein
MDDASVKEHAWSIVALIVGGFVTIMQWFMGREIKRRDSDIAALKAVDDGHSQRLRAIEIDHVKRSDIADIHRHLESMRERAEERHMEILDRIR